MNILFITFTSLTSIFCFSQGTQNQLTNPTTNPKEISTLLTGVDKDALKLFKSFSNDEIILKEGNENEIMVEEIKIGCGNNFFYESENQHAMIVMGKWCGDSYFWAPVNMGAKITEEAFRNNELFTGECIDQDSIGNLIAKYSFENGKLTSLNHFHKDGKLFQEYVFDKGIPDGIYSEYSIDGILNFRRTYDQGVLNGPFYEIYYTDDPDCRMRIDEGNYTNNEKLLIKSVCN
jgi:antitoxin component YwqK of YwqJK toxin-antitoxin module